jgi:hypothetical protein
MFIEVWNERFPPEKGKAWQEQASVNSKPLKGDFMGCARLELQLPSRLDKATCNKPVVQELTVPLIADFELVPRKVTGKITIRYEWTPEDPSGGPGPTEEGGVLLAGSLKLTLISATNLINLNLGRTNGAYSNPYCMALCYPKSTAVCGGLVQPCIWRAPLANNTLNPEWNCSHSFSFAWFNTPGRGSLRHSPKATQPKWDAMSPKEALSPGVPPGAIGDGDGNPEKPSKVAPVTGSENMPMPPSHMPPTTAEAIDGQLTPSAQ